ncbi:hypothetical protein KUM39_27820 [Streptomyces sp. J2-1]|uniref:hypothetical protein n=1 Tax=Streptomyces corallincola TaxID=2851888 RepID=UPI001C38E5D3|nr:hypothetical protein [Streptomyces corallincola]MBV2358107.1 hypothetical protein [Streptomyces corallincola]
MSLDLIKLTRVANTLEEAYGLLTTEGERLSAEYGPRPEGGMVAGDPSQTLQGVSDMSRGLTDALKRLVLAVGYSSLGMHRKADHELRMAQAEPLCFPSGADRMARPLGQDTVRAMELIRDLDFFSRDVSIAIDVALAAPQATYPPADWKEYMREQRARSDRP